MKSILKKYYIAFLLTLVMFLPVQTISAQTNTVYPVELNAFLTPPYTPCFMEYTEAGRFQLNIIRKDLYHKNWKFYVKMTVASFGGSSIVAYSDEISLGQGLHTPFLDFRQFIKNCPTLANCLKEGNYNLVFEAVDRSTGSDVSLSRPFTVSAYMERGKAPYLFAPYDEQNFPVGTAVTNFSWQLPKMTAEFLQYKLEVIDITDKGISANAAFESMLPQTPDGLCEYTTATSFVWNKALIDGHTYAWRVSAVNADKSPKTGFENNGISKVFSFTCGKKVDPFEEMMEKESEKILTSKKVDDDLDVLKMDKVEMSFKDIMAFWVKDNDEIRKKYSGVSIEIQPLGKDKWTPYSILYSESGDETLSLPILVDKDLTHVARGQYFILDEDGERIYAPYSDTIHFVIPGEPSEDPECGSPLPELSDCSGKNLPEKQDIQEIYCHGTKIDVESISSYSKNNDYIVLSGNGFLSFKFAKIFKLKVKFDNIKINCAKELMQGSVVTVYDEKNALKLDLNEIFGGKTVDGDQKTEQVESPTIKTTPSDTPGDFWKDGSDIKMRGADGSVITVGSVTSVSSLSYDNSEIKSDNENGTVRFTDATTPFDDDKLGLKDVLAGYYIPFDEGRLYYIPYVAVTHGNVSKVTVSVSDKCKDVKYIVKLSQDEVLELNVENGKVLVPGNNTTKSSQVYAISKNSEGKYVNVGSLLVSNFAVESKTLHIVPLTDETVSDASALQAYINNIYAGLGYEFKVSVENKLVDEWITENVLKDGGLKIAADDQSAWTSMTDEMKKVCSIYMEHNEDNVKDGDLYLFLVPNAEESKYKGTAGDLPRSQSVGFIFTDNAKPGTAEFNHTVVHELGHAFNLQHLFEHSKKIKQGSTSNLMDYNTVASNDLLHFQWHNIHNERIWVWPVLEDDDDGLYRSWEHLGYTIIEKLEPNEYSFILRDGDKVLRFEIPNNAVDLGFCDSYLHSFTIDGERWIALFEDVENKHIFKGFYKDAEKVGDSYKIKGKQKFPITKKLDVNGEYYFAVARTCPAVDVYKFSYVSGLSIKNDIEPRYESAKNNTSPSSYVRTVDNYLNCLRGNLRTFYKYVIDHYASYDQALSKEDETNLYKALSKFKDIHVLTSEELENGAKADFDFDDMRKRQYLVLIDKLNSIDGKDALQIKLEDPNVYYAIAQTNGALLDCIEKNSDLKKLVSETPENNNIFEQYVRVMEYIRASVHDASIVLKCLLDQLYIQKSFWHPERLDYSKEEYGLLKSILSFSINSNFGTFGFLPHKMEDDEERVACASGAWNGLVEAVGGIPDMAAMLTDLELERKIRGITLEKVEEKIEALKSLDFEKTLNFLGELWNGIAKEVKEFHGFKEDGFDKYQLSYAQCYDIVTIATIFVSVEELAANAIKNGAKKASSVFMQLVKKTESGHLIKPRVVAKGNKLVSSVDNTTFVKFEENGAAKIEKKAEKFSEIDICPEEMIIDGEMGYLVIASDGAAVFKSKDFVDCVTKYKTKLGEDLHSFIVECSEFSDDIIKSIDDDVIDIWKKMKSMKLDASKIKSKDFVDCLKKYKTKLGEAEWSSLIKDCSEFSDDIIKSIDDDVIDIWKKMKSMKLDASKIKSKDFVDCLKKYKTKLGEAEWSSLIKDCSEFSDDIIKSIDDDVIDIWKKMKSKKLDVSKIKSKDFVDCLKKYKKKLGEDEWSSLIGDCFGLSDDIIKSIDDEAIDIWKQMKSLGVDDGRQMMDGIIRTRRDNETKDFLRKFKRFDTDKQKSIGSQIYQYAKAAKKFKNIDDFKKIKSIEELDWGTIKYFLDCGLTDEIRFSIIGKWIDNKVFPTNTMNSLSNYFKRNSSELNIKKLIDINLRASVSMEKVSEKELKQVQKVAEALFEEAKQQEEFVKAMPSSYLGRYVNADGSRVEIPEKFRNFSFCISVPTEAAGKKLSVENKINVLGLDFGGTTWTPNNEFYMQLRVKKRPELESSLELNKCCPGCPNNGGTPLPPYSGTGFTQGMGLDMFIRENKKVPFKEGDLIEIFDKEGNKIFELKYKVDGDKASFVPSKAYENNIDKLKELYTKQSIK